MLGAPFVAALEIMIYAGAIMVLFVFVVMMLNLGEHAMEVEREWLKPRNWLRARPACSDLVGRVGLLYCDSAAHVLSPAQCDPKQVGIALFGRYWIGVELASLLLMAGLVGAFHLGRHAIAREEKHMSQVPMQHVLILAAILFMLGLTGLLTRRNLIFTLMCIEIMLNASGLAFVAAGSRWAQPDGQVMFLFILAMAAAEVSVGLAFVLLFHKTAACLGCRRRQRYERLICCNCCGLLWLFHLPAQLVLALFGSSLSRRLVAVLGAGSVGARRTAHPLDWRLVSYVARRWQCVCPAPVDVDEQRRLSARDRLLSRSCIAPDASGRYLRRLSDSSLFG